jgi:acyl-CoA synthetase (AMP-forming)/AMP-acid ligase II
LLVRDYLFAHASNSPHKSAFIDGDRRHSWAEVAERSSRLARVLRERGIGKGDVVASLALDGMEVIELWYASAILGTVRTGINWRYAPREVAHILHDADVKALVVENGSPSDTFAKIEDRATQHVLRFGGDDDDYERALAKATPLDPSEWEPLTPDDPIAISYTTGSTGLPKGAVWRHGAVVAAQLHTWIEAGGRRDDVYLHCIPAAGVPVMLATWNTFVGSTIVLQDRFSAHGALDLIERERVTSTLLVPTMLTDILDVPAFEHYDLSSLRLIIYGSAPATSALVTRAISAFGCELQQWYGATEAVGGWFSILRHDDHLRALDGRPELLQSCGKPMVHTRIKVASSDGTAVPAGEVGEVCVRSETLMDGYLGLADETADALHDGWLHTGDLGKVDDEGYLYLVDRKKFMIITGGYNVYPVVVENVLGSHPAVREVCVFGIPDERWGESVCAVVVPDGDIAATDLIEYCRAHLAAFEVPKHVVVRHELPRGATGKILKRAVRDEVRELLASKAVATCQRQTRSPAGDALPYASTISLMSITGRMLV